MKSKWIEGVARIVLGIIGLLALGSGMALNVGIVRGTGTLVHPNAALITSWVLQWAGIVYLVLCSVAWVVVKQPFQRKFARE